MSVDKVADRFRAEFLEIFDETFVKHHGIFLDENTSLFETLDTVSAAEASRPVSATCASLAAQTKHVAFYLDVLGAYMRDEELEHVDWGEIWRTVEKVDNAEWQAIKAELQASYRRVLELVERVDDWSVERTMAGALACLTHSAYHLGEIRQALCTLKA